MGFSKLFDSGKGSKPPHTNRTICELHRELYDLCVLRLYKKDPELMMEMIRILEDAFIMGVKMNKKLCEYKLGSSSKWDKKEYRNEDVDRKVIAKRRRKRERLEKMLKDNNTTLKRFNKREE